MGRIFAVMTAVAGIGLIAIPTGILAAALSDAMHKHKYDCRKSLTMSLLGETRLRRIGSSNMRVSHYFFDVSVVA